MLMHVSVVDLIHNKERFGSQNLQQKLALPLRRHKSTHEFTVPTSLSALGAPHQLRLTPKSFIMRRTPTVHQAYDALTRVFGRNWQCCECCESKFV